MSTDPTYTEHPDTFNARADLTVGDRTYEIFNITAPALSERYDIARLPYSIKVLLENLLRHEDGPKVTPATSRPSRAGAPPECHGRGRATTPTSSPSPPSGSSCRTSPAFPPSSTSPPCATRSPWAARLDQPTVPVELVIDHSVIAERRATRPPNNVEIEYERNIERYKLSGGHRAPSRLPGGPARHGDLPPGQPRVPVAPRLRHRDGQAFCDTLVGTDSHTVMVNGLGVLGWGVGGIEAEAAMLGQPLSMLLPPVVGLRISGETKPGITATDVVLTVTELLRDHGVVGKFVECYGPGVGALPSRQGRPSGT